MIIIRTSLATFNNQTLEQALQDGPFFFGAQPTVPDFISGMQTIWEAIFPIGIVKYPNLVRHLKALCEGPSVKRMLAQHAGKTNREKAQPDRMSTC